MSIRAGDLTPGLYHAHGSSTANCVVHVVTPINGGVQVDYTINGKRLWQTHDCDRIWKVEHAVINEEIDWSEMLGA